MVVGHRLDCYSCFPSFSQFSSVTPRHGSLAQDIPQSFTLIPDVPTSNLASCGTPSVGSTTVVISQSLSRSALNVSLLRYIAFLFRLLVCLVPSSGVTDMYQKALRAEVEEDIFPPISYIPATYRLPHLLPFSSPRPPITVHPVADCLFISLFEQLLRLQLRWTTLRSWWAYILPDSPGSE